MKPAGSFRGTSTHRINDSGRISVPSKFRDVLRSRYGDETLVLVLARSNIIAYPVVEWEKKEAEWEANPPQTREEMKMFRRIYASAEEVAIDKQGRILVPPKLRAERDLVDECIILGLGNRFEIWAKSAWDREMGTDDEEFDGIEGAIGEKFNEISL